MSEKENLQLPTALGILIARFGEGKINFEELENWVNSNQSQKVVTKNLELNDNTRVLFPLIANHLHYWYKYSSYGHEWPEKRFLALLDTFQANLNNDMITIESIAKVSKVSLKYFKRLLAGCKGISTLRDGTGRF